MVITQIWRTAFGCAIALALAGCDFANSNRGSAPPTTGVTDEMIAASPDGEWLSYGRDYREQRFSPLNQITADNVGDLGLAWFADLDTARGQEATPLVYDGVLYVSTAWSKVLAFDAKTGALKWSYDPEVPRETLVTACCDAVNRGVALYGDKVFVATLDGRLVGLNQADGKVAWSTNVVPDKKNYAITGAPRAGNGMVFIGSGGAEFKARGFIAAFDWDTGEELWRWHTVPGNPADGFENEAMKRAAATWGGKWWELGGGGTVWDSITYDPVTNLVIFGTANPEPWNPGANSRDMGGTDDGNALFTASIVALHADTGEYAWHFQQTPEDRWDYDSNAQITIADVKLNGEARRVILHAPKNGYFYVLDAATGSFIHADAWTAMNWSTGIDPVTGKPEVNPAALYDQTGKVWLGLPGAAGAHSWHPMSYSPDTGLVYIPAILAGYPYLADEEFEVSELQSNLGIDGAGVAIPASNEIREQILAATTGALVAWDPVARKEGWRVPHIGPWNGGTLATAGNLVFQGNASEDFVAYSADSGDRLWSFAAQTGIIAAPISYAIDGEQYIAILAGWGGLWDVATGLVSSKAGPPRNISRLLVFKLGASGKLPPPPPMVDMVLDPPAFTGTQEQVALGARRYARFCFSCHGADAIAGVINPDLRHSAVLGSADVMRSIVIDGILAERGMVSFAQDLSPAEAEAIRQYIIFRANEDKSLEGRRGQGRASSTR